MSRWPAARILLADDDEEDQELLRDALYAVAPKAEISSVWNGQEAVSYLAQCPEELLPDVIVLDYKMPLLNGAEVLEHLAKGGRYGGIPKIVWSSSNRQEFIDRCMQSGASLFLTKPNDEIELKEITQKILRLCDQSS